jgi:DNA polymerase IV
VIVDPGTELDFLNDPPVDLMWGVGPGHQGRLAEIGVLTLERLAKTPGWSLERLLGPAASEGLTLGIEKTAMIRVRMLGFGAV